MKNVFRISVVSILVFQMGCATQHHSIPHYNSKYEFEGFPTPSAPQREVANEDKMAVRKFYGGNRTSLLGPFSRREGEIYLYDYALASFSAPEKSRMKSEDINLVLTISKERSALLNNNLYDTGIDTDKTEQLLGKVDGQRSTCEKMMAVPHRQNEGNCYFFGLAEKNMNKHEFSQLKFHEKPQIGNNEARFGRNMPVPTDDKIETYKKDIVQPANASTEMMSPNPRLISKELLARKNGIQKAEIINVLAAAWLQSMNHDWFSHGKNVSRQRQQKEVAANPELAKMFEPFMIPNPEFPDDRSKDMMIPRTRPDMTHMIGKKAEPSANGYPVTFRNTVTHWWDASHIYGSDSKTVIEVRTSPKEGFLKDGKIAVDEKNKRLYYKDDGTPLTGFSDNWWTGLEMVHTLFALEHNKIVDMLKKTYPSSRISKDFFGNQPLTELQTGEWYFQKARLIVSALLARIHTVEWTPALLDNKALHVGMYANWHGLLSGLRGLPTAASDRLFSEKNKQAFMGLTGNAADLYLYKVPFTLTEEFVAVYRMHPLIPDNVQYYNIKGEPTQSVGVEDMLFTKSQKHSYAYDNATTDLMLSFGVNNPGAMTLNNYPDFIRNVKIKHNTDDPSEDIVMDMGAVDVLRDRERFVPRYNEFRRQLGRALRDPALAKEIKASYPMDKLPLEPIKSFEELTDNPEHLAALKKVYDNDVEKLDLVIGSLAEKDRYQGYAFGNTAFYIFAIMASRRLMADPFFNKYYIPEVYTKEGISWVENSSMAEVIKRNFPELAGKFTGVTNAFQPWNLKAK